MQLQSVNDGMAGAQNRLVLFGVAFRKFLGKHVTHMATDQLPFFSQTASFYQRLIYRHIMTAPIFYEEDGFGNMIEELFDHWQHRQRVHDRTRQQAGLCKYVRFHSAAVILRQALTTAVYYNHYVGNK